MHVIAANVEGQEEIGSEAANFANGILYNITASSVELNGSMFSSFRSALTNLGLGGSRGVPNLFCFRFTEPRLSPCNHVP